MADDMFDAEDDVASTDEAQAGRKRFGFLSGVFLQVLKWVGIILAVVIFVVTVTYVTVRLLTDRGPSQTRIPVSEDYRPDQTIYAWYEAIPELRGTTADETQITYQVRLYIGYDEANRQLTTELISRRIQLIGLFNSYFSSRTVAELRGAGRQALVEKELLERVNRILRSGQIRAIVFETYQFFEF